MLRSFIDLWGGWAFYLATPGEHLPLPAQRLRRCQLLSQFVLDLLQQTGLQGRLSRTTLLTCTMPHRQSAAIFYRTSAVEYLFAD
jgi:hypothetical protein